LSVATATFLNDKVCQILPLPLEAINVSILAPFAPNSALDDEIDAL